MNETIRPRLLAEAIGTFALTFVAGASICADSYSGGATGLLGVALAHGLVLGGLVTALAPLSQAHLNPAVTIAALAGRSISPLGAAAYVAAQLGGAVVAGGMLLATFAVDVWEPVRLGVPMPGPGVASGTAAFLEATFTFVLVLVMLRAVVAPGGRRPGSGLAVGAVYAVGVLVAGPLTGGGLNPARAFGPALAAGFWNAHWVYWVGPVMGGVVAAVIEAFLRTGPSGETVSGQETGSETGEERE